ncbi:hypothetical protein CK203_042194 [Vitis vinifera]|uniref:Uncharacterized protein n=1 Tax=Vitis vinifera TaxID=29760 RepID=A0A438HPX4_VITVI|nr:hypothetical protein CK203_042194 [Vitis vinifera]
MLLALHDLVHLEMVSQPKRFLELQCIKSNHGKDVQLICSHKSSYLGFKKFREKGKDFNAAIGGSAMEKNSIEARKGIFLQQGLHQDQQRPPASGTYTSLCLSTVATPFD